MSEPQAIEQTHSAERALAAAEMYVSIEVEKNSRSWTSRVKATVRWTNWDSSDPNNAADQDTSFMVPMGDGMGGPGIYDTLAHALDGLMKNGERAVATAIARASVAPKETGGEA